MTAADELSWLLVATLVMTTTTCSADVDAGGQGISSLEHDNLQNSLRRLNKTSNVVTETAVKTADRFLQGLLQERDPLVGEGNSQQAPNRERETRETRHEGSSGGSGSGDPLGEQFLKPVETPLDRYLLTPLALSAFLDALSLNVLTTVSTECSGGWDKLFNTTDSSGVNNGIKAVDAFGKLSAGYLQGNIYALGSYDECLSIASTQYCLAELSSETEVVDNELSLLYAYCLPQTCSENDIRASFNLTTSELGNVSFQIDSIRCESENKPPYNAGAIIMLLLWCLFAVMVTAATAVHITTRLRDKTRGSRVIRKGDAEAPRSSVKRKKRKETVMSFILSFSLYETVPKVLATSKQPPSAITCIHGIRVISVCWIILGHTHLWLSFFVANRSSYVRNVASRFSFRGVQNSVLGVDTFFMMSGLLLTYLTLRKMNRQKGRFRFPALPYYLHRILRLTPVYGFVLFSYWLLTVHLGDGPLWQQMLGPGSRFYQSCQRYWWTNLLYINNLYPSTHIDICMPWTWYLANDMQFFIFAPLVIVPLYHLYKAGLVIVGALLVVNLATLGGISGGYGLSANVAKLEELNQAYSDEGPEAHNVTDDLYTKPWTRVGPYLVGILMGFIFYQQLKPNFRRKYYNHVFYATLWLVAAGLCLSTVYGLKDTVNGDKLNRAKDISFQTFSRLAWSIGVAIVTFVCHNGYGWIVNDFLSMKFWIPLSRLTFLTYLLHGIVLFVLILTLREPIYGYDVTSALFTITAVVLSFGAAGVVSTFVEFPLSNVEAAVFKLAGLGEGESTRRSTVRRDAECVVKMNVGFEESDSGERREGPRREVGEGRERERKSILKVREDNCEVKMNVGFEEIRESVEESVGEGEREGVMEGVGEGEREGVMEGVGGVSEGVTYAVIEDVGGVVVEMEELVMEIVLDGVTEGGSDGVTEGRSEGGTEGGSEGGTEGRSEGGTEGGSEGGTEGRSEGGTEGGSEDGGSNSGSITHEGNE